ncbi:hypothetical protein [Undibacterium squillarum]|uniref:hypothetical protein n=1 Tax=Undibacterium squillarum TaxID=1131567 RepID=UPI001E3BA3B2|nr:hypothetical protein [Undibacterium squillarum]
MEAKEKAALVRLFLFVRSASPPGASACPGGLALKNICKLPFSRQKHFKCGVQHSDPALAGRKSGSPKNENDDICTDSVR